jgi:hypothetical protein
LLTFCDSLPKTAIGKLHRRGLMQHDVGSRDPVLQGQPRPGTQSRPGVEAPSPVPVPQAS